jgi:hypothetical protein
LVAANIAGQAGASALLMRLTHDCVGGDELYRAFSELAATMDSADGRERMRGWCRALQKRLERSKGPD